MLVVHGTRGSLRADVGLMFTGARRSLPLPGAVERAANLLEEGVAPLAALPRHAWRLATRRLRSYEGVRAGVQAFYAALADGTPMPASLDDGTTVVHWVETA